MKTTGLIIALGLLTSACATSYGELGFFGGVAADQLSADTFRIRSRGNSNTEHGTVQDYALLRAAETVRGACMTHFVVLDEADRTIVSESVTPESETRTVEKKVVDGKVVTRVHKTWTPGSVSIGVEPGEDLVVRGLVVPAGHTAPADAVAADEVIRYVGARVKRRDNAPPPVFPDCSTQLAGVR